MKKNRRDKKETGRKGKRGEGRTGNNISKSGWVSAKTAN